MRWAKTRSDRIVIARSAAGATRRSRDRWALYVPLDCFAPLAITVQIFSRIADADHAEGQKLALLVAHRHVLADLEGVVAEAETFLLRFVLASTLPLERPGRAAAAAGVIDEEAAQRGLIAPEAMGETFAPMLLPGFEIDVAIGGQRRDEIITVPDRAIGEFLRARGVQRHLSQHDVTWPGHRPSSLFSRLFCEPLSLPAPMSGQTRSSASAAPWPTPTHIVARP